MSKGERYENNLATQLWNNDWAVLRAPGSGTVNRPSPDLLALKETKRSLRDGTYTAAYALELKASNFPVYLDESEIRELHAWCERGGVAPLVGVKPDLRSYDSPRYYTPSELDRTDGGNYVVREDTDWLDFDYVFE